MFCHTNSEVRNVSTLCVVEMEGFCVRIMKKILSKLCMFGLATTVSFGFGSFLAQANAPTVDDEGYEVFEGKSAVINMPEGALYVKAVVGNELTWNGAPQSLINLTNGEPSVLFHKGSDSTNVNGDVDVSSNTSAAAGFGNVWLRGKDLGISGADSGWVKVWSNGAFLSPIIPGESPTSSGEGLLNVKASASGNYKFYYYVDSTVFAKNGYGTGTSYTAVNGTTASGHIPTAAP